MTDEAASFLDNPETYVTMDPTGFGKRVGGLPSQCLSAWELGLRFSLPHDYGYVRNVVVVGMGGSAIGGELLGDLVSMEKSPLVTVCRDYDLPPYLGSDSLVIASSYSGNTEETLAASREALKRKAKLVAITTGGKLEQMASREGMPVFSIDYVGEPRTALGYSFLVPLAFLQNLKLIAPSDEAVVEAAEVMNSIADRLNPQVPTCDNPAKELAISLRGKLIVLYGGEILRGVARRWKTQFNENAKAWAFVELLPEAGHNAIAGLQWPHGVGRKACGVLLNAWSLHRRIKLRYQVIGELLSEAGVMCRTVDGVGRGVLAQMLSTILFGDYTSYYLALLNGEDPSPVSPIDYLKGKLEGLH